MSIVAYEIPWYDHFWEYPRIKHNNYLATRKYHIMNAEEKLSRQVKGVDSPSFRVRLRIFQPRR